MPTFKRDKTRNERQKRRRENERRWLVEHGFTSWESLHTKLMNGSFVAISLCEECGGSGRGKPTLSEPDGAEEWCDKCQE